MVEAITPPPAAVTSELEHAVAGSVRGAEKGFMRNAGVAIGAIPGTAAERTLRGAGTGLYLGSRGIGGAAKDIVNGVAEAGLTGTIAADNLLSSFLIRTKQAFVTAAELPGDILGAFVGQLAAMPNDIKRRMSGVPKDIYSGVPLTIAQKHQQLATDAAHAALKATHEAQHTALKITNEGAQKLAEVTKVVARRVEPEVLSTLEKPSIVQKILRAFGHSPKTGLAMAGGVGLTAMGAKMLVNRSHLSALANVNDTKMNDGQFGQSTSR